MAAGRFIGRVGGLAIALGVGTAVFAGAGAAWADSSSGDSHIEPERQTDGGSQVGVEVRAAEGGSRRERIAADREVRATVSPSPLAPNGYQRRWQHPRPRWGSTIVTDPDVEWVDGSSAGTVGATRRATCPDLHGGRCAEPGRKDHLHCPFEGRFSYLAYSSTLTDSSQNEQFSIAAETTGFDEFLVASRSSVC